MLPEERGHHRSVDATAADIANGAFNVYIIKPDKKVKVVIYLPDEHRSKSRRGPVAPSIWCSSPRNQVATPGQLEARDEVIIVPGVSDEEAKEKYPAGWKAPKPYMRIVPQPRS